MGEVEVFTAAMRAALRERGFSGRSRRWRRDAGAVPLQVYAERARWDERPTFTVGVLFGGGQVPMRADGTNAVVQSGLEDYTGQRSWYDLARRRQAEAFASDFSAVVLPLVDDITEPRDVIEGLLRGRIIPVQSFGTTARSGQVIVALHAIEEYGLHDLLPAAEAALRAAISNWADYERLSGVAASWPDDHPLLVQLMQSVPALPRPPEQRPTWRERVRERRSRRWSSW